MVLFSFLNQPHLQDGETGNGNLNTKLFSSCSARFDSKNKHTWDQMHAAHTHTHTRNELSHFTTN